MKSKVMTIDELKKNNPTLCLSPLRVFNECHKCRVFKLKQSHGTLNKIKCKPQLHPKYQTLLKQKRRLLDELKQIDKEIDGL